MLGKYLENVRKNKPLVHNITNYVTVNGVANTLLACTASPIMADDAEEVAQICSICSALNLNIGTLNARTIKSMLIAAKTANKNNIPVVLDPVGAGASSLRTKTALQIIDSAKIDLIKGNYSEIKVLANAASSQSRGVDVSESDAKDALNLPKVATLAKDLSKKRGFIVVITGKTDIVADSQTAYAIYNGRPEMGSITGTGCQLSGMLAAFLAANKTEPLLAAAAAVATMGVAGEIAYASLQEGDGNMAYAAKIIDALYNMSGQKLDNFAKYELC